MDSVRGIRDLLVDFYHAKGVYFIRNLLRYIINAKHCISSSRREYTLARDEIRLWR